MAVLTAAQMPGAAEMRKPQPELTAEQLAASTGATTQRATGWLRYLPEAMAVFAINTPARMAAFLAQIGHESGGLKYVTEIWGPTSAQLRYERDPNAPWSARVNGERHRNTKPFELGNERPGDGRKYKGHGLIQTTGRTNHARTRNGLRAYMSGVPDFELAPEMLEQPKWAALSAGWFWSAHGLNALADGERFEQLTQRINGGLNGLSDRLALYKQASEVLNVTQERTA